MSKFLMMMVAVSFGMASTASAHDPEDIAHRCAHRVNQIVHRCNTATAEETHECVRKINALLEQGRVDAAHAVARECIQSATERTRKCIHAVDTTCEECIDILLRLGAPDLARRIANICDHAVEVLKTTLQREKNIIREALAG